MCKRTMKKTTNLDPEKLLARIEYLEENRRLIQNALEMNINPMGPLTLLDFVGLDTTYYIAEIMFKEFKDTR